MLEGAVIFLPFHGIRFNSSRVQVSSTKARQKWQRQKRKKRKRLKFEKKKCSSRHLRSLDLWTARSKSTNKTR
jgi:hypothetical protein